MKTEDNMTGIASERNESISGSLDGVDRIARTSSRDLTESMNENFLRVDSDNMTKMLSNRSLRTSTRTSERQTRRNSIMKSLAVLDIDDDASDLFKPENTIYSEGEDSSCGSDASSHHRRYLRRGSVTKHKFDAEINGLQPNSLSDRVTTSAEDESAGGYQSGGDYASDNEVPAPQKPSTRNRERQQRRNSIMKSLAVLDIDEVNDVLKPKNSIDGGGDSSDPSSHHRRYLRRGSVTKHKFEAEIGGLQPNSISERVTASADDEDVGGYQSEGAYGTDNESAAQKKRRYLRRGSVTKYSLDAHVGDMQPTNVMENKSNNPRRTLPPPPKPTSNRNIQSSSGSRPPMSPANPSTGGGVDSGHVRSAKSSSKSRNLDDSGHKISSTKSKNLDDSGHRRSSKSRNLDDSGHSKRSSKSKNLDDSGHSKQSSKSKNLDDSNHSKRHSSKSKNLDDSGHSKRSSMSKTVEDSGTMRSSSKSKIEDDSGRNTSKTKTTTKKDTPPPAARPSLLSKLSSNRSVNSEDSEQEFGSQTESRKSPPRPQKRPPSNGVKKKSSSFSKPKRNNSARLKNAPPSPTATPAPIYSPSGKLIKGILSHGKRSAEMKNVRFGDLVITEFPIILGDNPAVTMGAPVTIDWEAQGEISYKINVYESIRGNRRRRRKLLISVSNRAILLLAAGYSIDEIADASINAQQIKFGRQESMQNQRWDSVNMMMETAGGAVGSVGGAVGSVGTLMGGTVGTVGNIMGGTVGTVGNIMGGTVGSVGTLMGDTGKKIRAIVKPMRVSESARTA